MNMTVPGGEFSFRELCVANPSISPMELLKFVTTQISEGRLKKTRCDKGVTFTEANPARTGTGETNSDPHFTMTQVPVAGG
ncbi:MAG TPA: hypothetical protein VEH04_05010 [Verrucomicrobiae bacterium]|nr:hypothetical protein [Verrucomicrobiae bacterium]